MAGIECGKIDISKLSEDDFIAIGDRLWLKADVDEKIYIWRNEPNVVIKFNNPCLTTVCDDQAAVLRPILFMSTALEATAESVNQDGPPNVERDNARDKKATYACGPDLENLKKIQDALDAHSVNNRGDQPAAIMPSAATIPMKSNIKVYGPYASSNFGNSAGGTQVNTEPDLCPWVFGSIAAMNAAGNSMVSSSAIGLVRSETGSITIPGLPDITSLGATVNSSGPNLSDINFTFGSSGITTSYQFRTFTPKFGGLNRHFLDKFKSIAKNRQTQIKFLRGNQINQNKINSKIARYRQNNPQQAAMPSPGRQASLQRIIMGEMYDWQYQTGSNLGQRTVVGTSTMSKSTVEMIYEYDKKAFMSLDGLFGPVSIGGDGGLPRYAYTNPNGHKASPILPHPPFTKDDPCSSSSSSSSSASTSTTHDELNIDITQKYLNPLTNKFEEGSHHHKGPGNGHVIDMVGRETTIPDSGLITNFYKKDDDKRYSNDYRFLGMRGPLVLHSWGYDLEGKPVPNSADREDRAKQGIFESSKLKDEFLDDWLAKPATWPVAPVDLRFDRNRGVWVSPQPYKIIVAKIVKEVEPYNDGKAIIIPYGKPLFTQDSQQVTVPSSPISCETGYKKISQWILSSIGALPPECGIDVITGLSLESGCLVATRKRVTVMSHVDLAPIVIETASCETSSSSSSSGSATPSAPTITGAVCGDNTITVSWTAPSDSNIPAIDGYIISYRKRDPSNPNAQYVSIQVGLCQASRIIGGLTNGIEYEISVRAKNSNGPGASSSTVTATPCANGDCVITEPTPETSTSSSTEVAFIKIVDRIGRRLKVDDLVYAYYDTSTEEYIALEQNPVAATPTIYGTYSPTSCTEGYFTVKYAAGLDSSDNIAADTVITVKNLLGFKISTSTCAVPAIAIKMDKL